MARKQRTGVVVSDKMDKTVVVRVERTVQHPLYKKIMRRRKQFQAHDETNVCALGDQVLIEECRPLSRHKQWRVVEILERHEVADVQPRDIQAPALTPAQDDAPAPASESPAPKSSAPESPAPESSAAEPTAPETTDTPDAPAPDESVPADQAGDA